MRKQEREPAVCTDRDQAAGTHDSSGRTLAVGADAWCCFDWTIMLSSQSLSELRGSQAGTVSPGSWSSFDTISERDNARIAKRCCAHVVHAVIGVWMCLLWIVWCRRGGGDESWDRVTGRAVPARALRLLPNLCRRGHRGSSGYHTLWRSKEEATTESKPGPRGRGECDLGVAANSEQQR